MSDSKKVLLLEELAKEIRQSFYQVKAVMEVRGVFGDIGRWGGVILGVLFRQGERTIPQLLEELPLTRQYIQKEVAKLTAAGLVVSVENPAHKSSKLIRCTATGKREYHQRRDLYMDLYQDIESEFTQKELGECLSVLKKLQRVIDR